MSSRRSRDITAEERMQRKFRGVHRIGLTGLPWTEDRRAPHVEAQVQPRQYAFEARRLAPRDLLRDQRARRHSKWAAVPRA